MPYQKHSIDSIDAGSSRNLAARLPASASVTAFVTDRRRPSSLAPPSLAVSTVLAVIPAPSQVAATGLSAPGSPGTAPWAPPKGLESVTGSSQHSKLVEQLHVKCPKSGEDDREAFEAAVREAGVWDQVASLNAVSFSTLWRKEDLSPAVRQALSPFVSETSKTVARLKKGGREQG